MSPATQTAGNTRLVGPVVERQAQGTGLQLDGLMLRVRLVEDQRQVLALFRRLALHVDELRRMGDGVEHDDEFGRKLERQRCPFARRQFHRIEDDLLDDLREVLGQIDSRPPEELALVIPHRQCIGVVAGDLANAGRDREGHLHHLVEGGLITRAAERAAIGGLLDRLEAGAGIEHAAATGAEHVPRDLEDAEPRRVEKSRDGALFIQALLAGKRKRVDAIEGSVRCVAHRALHGIDNRAVRRLAENGEKRLLCHGPPLRGNEAATSGMQPHKRRMGHFVVAALRRPRTPPHNGWPCASATNREPA